MPHPEEIADPTYRLEMEEANAALNDGRYLEAVRRCAEAYLSLLQTRALTEDELAVAARWPRLGVRLVLDDPRLPVMTWDRDRFSFAEAITYYEFTLEQLIRLTAPAS